MTEFAGLIADVENIVGDGVKVLHETDDPRVRFVATWPDGKHKAVVTPTVEKARTLDANTIALLFTD